MKKTIYTLLFLVFAAQIAHAQTVAQKRAAQMKVGMNLSYLDNYWLGTKAKHFSDFVKPKEAAKREQMFADIGKAGFVTVRIPIDFGAWASINPPYHWENEEGLKTADSFVKWALANDLNAIIDLHHTEFDNTIPNAAATERIVWLWREIAARYKDTNPDKVFFEIRNEPHDVNAEQWRTQAETIIKAIREIAPNHTLIVGFHDWNSPTALVSSKPFADQNIIYTFHYYDPFIFTHQGATWTSEGLAQMKNVPFPADAKRPLKTPDALRGKWEESLIKNYEKDSSAGKMFADLKAVKDWAVKYDVPVFLGEFGSFSKFAATEDRCRHAATVYAALGKLDIPNAWWEWDGGFNMFEKGTTKIMPCMRAAIETYNAGK